MGQFESPLSSKIDVTKVLKSFTDRDIQIDNEIKITVKAVTDIQNYFLLQTEQWKTKPVYENDRLLTEGVEETVLVQFKPENKTKFLQPATVIDSGMRKVPFAINSMRKDLYRLEMGQVSMMPMSPEVQVPQVMMPPQEKKSKLDSLRNVFTPQKPQVNRESPYYKQELQLQIDAQTPQKWYLLKAHTLKCFADSNAVSYTSESTRAGMEYILKVLGDFFNYWITTKFLFLHGYACELELKEHMALSKSGFDALTYAQKRYEESQPFQSTIS